MKYSLNVPLTRREVKKLPLGFTPTSFGLTGQEIKRQGRAGFPHTNRKRTRGRILQMVAGKVIWHRNFERIINR